MNKSAFFTAFIPTLLIFLLLYACQVEKSNNQMEQRAQEYYATYQSRKNFEKFLEFYSDSIRLEDMIMGVEIQGKENLKAFFDWPNPNFEPLDSINLHITQQQCNGNAVSTQGYFAAFKWKDVSYPPMHFSTTLIFNQELKIIQHTDWINYPQELLPCEQRQNSNQWIQGNKQ